MANERSEASYRAWLLRQPCACAPCVAPVVIHHSTVGETAQHSKSLGGRRGKGQRASDAEGIAVCHRHHANFHELRGYFADFDKARLRSWQDEQVQRLQRLFAMAHPEPLAPGAAPKRPRANAGDAAHRERLRIAEYIRDRAGEARLKPNEAALLTDLASEIEAQRAGGDF